MLKFKIVFVFFTLLLSFNLISSADFLNPSVHWGFEDIGEDIIYDQSGDKDLLFKNPIQSQGKYGYSLKCDGNSYGEYNTSCWDYNEIIMNPQDHSGWSSPHTVFVVKPNSEGNYGGHTYWGYVGEQTWGNIDLFFSEDLIHWTPYQNNPIISGNEVRWPTTIYEEEKFYMVHTVNFHSGPYFILKESSNGINFNQVCQITQPISTSPRVGTLNPYLFKDPNSGDIYLYYQYQTEGPNAIEQIRYRKASTIQELCNSSEEELFETDYDLYWGKTPAVFFNDGKYWMLTEGYGESSSVDVNYDVFAYYSDSPEGEFTAFGSVLQDNSACPHAYVENGKLYNYVCYKDGGDEITPGKIWKIRLVKSDLNNLFQNCLPEKTFDLDNDFSFSLWFKTDGASEFQYIFNKGDTSPSFEGKGIVSRLEKDTGYLRFLVDDNIAPRGIIIENNLADNTWHNLAVSKNSEEIKVYLDNNFQDSISLDNVQSFDSDKDNVILAGKEYRNIIETSSRFNGELDEVLFYDRTLTEEEISLIYELSVRNYYTKEEVNMILSNYYTKEQIDQKFENMEKRVSRLEVLVNFIKNFLDIHI